jgi:hypothetical protein
MSNYSKYTDFAQKDTLPSGNAGKLIKGTEFDDEFEAIETAIATKADLAGPSLTGTVTINSKTAAVLGTQQDFAKAQYTSPTAVDLSTDVQVDLSTSNVFIVTLTGDGHALTTSNMVSGGCYTFVIKNTGFGDINFGSEFYFAGGEPTITSGAGSRDLISCVSDGTDLYCAISYDLEAS